MSTKPILADAVIIGGGAAGSFCAITAARRGLSVIVLEPNEISLTENTLKLSLPFGQVKLSSIVKFTS